LATADGFAGNGLTRFLVTTVTKLASEMFSAAIIDETGRKFLAEAVAAGLPLTMHTTSLYDFAVALFAAPDEAASRRIDGA
jgi:hypothetical protein